MIDRRFIGRAYPRRTIEVEKGRLQFFAKTIGETNPIYTDEAAAQASGYRSLLAPPTFTRCLETELYNAVEWLGEMGIDISRILHGEQSFITCRSAPMTFDDRLAGRLVESRVAKLRTPIAKRSLGP